MSNERLKARLSNWNASCNTCGSSLFDEEWTADEPRTFGEDDARFWADDHRCIRDVHVAAPSGALSGETPEDQNAYQRQEAAEATAAGSTA